MRRVLRISSETAMAASAIERQQDETCNMIANINTIFAKEHEGSDYKEGSYRLRSHNREFGYCLDLLEALLDNTETIAEDRRNGRVRVINTLEPGTDRNIAVLI
jgi:hypothetical protein